MRRSTLPLRGFSTLEIMLAAMVLTSAITALVLVIFGLPQALANGHELAIAENADAALLTQNMLAGASSFSLVIPIASTTIQGFTSSLEVIPSLDGLTKELIATTEWIDERHSKRTLTLTAWVTDFTHTELNTCSDVLQGDWQHPTYLTRKVAPGDLLPLGASLTTHPITVAEAGSSTLAIGVTSATNKTNPVLFLFDISSSTNPRYLGSHDNASSTRAGFAAITLAGSMLFAASSHGANFSSCIESSVCSQLQIFDITNPSNPTLVRDFQLPTTTPPFAIGSGTQSAGKSIFYNNGFVYLGLQKTGTTGGDEFNIIDVHDPSHPVWLGGYSVGRTVNQIIVRGDTAYLATDDPSRELIVLNVHDPTNVFPITSYDAPGNTYSGYGESLAGGNTNTALGRSYAYGEPEFYLFDTSSSTLRLENSQAMSAASSSIQGILFRNFLTYILTNTALEIWDMHTPNASTLYTPTLVLPAGSSVSGTDALACSGNTLYIASSDSAHNGYLSIITGS